MLCKVGGGLTGVELSSEGEGDDEQEEQLTARLAAEADAATAYIVAEAARLAVVEEEAAALEWATGEGGCGIS